MIAIKILLIVKNINKAFQVIFLYLILKFALSKENNLLDI